MLKVEDIHELLGQIVLNAHLERKAAVEMLRAKDERIKELEEATKQKAPVAAGATEEKKGK